MCVAQSRQFSSLLVTLVPQRGSLEAVSGARRMPGLPVPVAGSPMAPKLSGVARWNGTFCSCPCLPRAGGGWAEALCPRGHLWTPDPSVLGGSAIFEGPGVLGRGLRIQEAERRGVEDPGAGVRLHRDASFAPAPSWTARRLGIAAQQRPGEMGFNGHRVAHRKRGASISMAAVGRRSKADRPRPCGHTVPRDLGALSHLLVAGGHVPEIWGQWNTIHARKCS